MKKNEKVRPPPLPHLYLLRDICVFLTWIGMLVKALMNKTIHKTIVNTDMFENWKILFVVQWQKVHMISLKKFLFAKQKKRWKKNNVIKNFLKRILVGEAKKK